VHFAHQYHPLEWGVCAGLIDECSGLSQSTISAHLATLQRAGLVTSQRVGHWIFFKRDEDAIKVFLSHMNNEL
jgi:ArsR family transcriptional regulator